MVEGGAALRGDRGFQGRDPVLEKSQPTEVAHECRSKCPLPLRFGEEAQEVLPREG